MPPGRTDKAILTHSLFIVFTIQLMGSGHHAPEFSKLIGKTHPFKISDLHANLSLYDFGNFPLYYPQSFLSICDYKDVKAEHLLPFYYA